MLEIILYGLFISILGAWLTSAVLNVIDQRATMKLREIVRRDWIREHGIVIDISPMR